MKYLIGNWKSQKTTAEGKDWIKNFTTAYTPKKEILTAVAPTAVSIESLSGYIKEFAIKNFALVSQDISQFPKGNYTGAIAADLLKGLVRYAIIGHSERVRYFHETVPEILNKAEEAVACGITPLVCVQDEKTLFRLRSLEDLEIAPLVAYTPLDPLISNVPENCETLIAMAEKIKHTIPAAKVLYGGAITSENCKEYLQITEIDGLFVGKASLKAEDFAAICNLL